MDGANSSEFDPETPYPIIDLLPEQRQIEDRGGTMRLGSGPVHLVEGTLAHKAYGGASVVYERHRHRYEVNPAMRADIENAGLIVSGRSHDARLVEVVELADHPFFCASQFHPEFTSRPTRPQPIFREFVAAMSRVAGLALGPDEVDAPTPASR
jgi:CTP synthase